MISILNLLIMIISIMIVNTVYIVARQRIEAENQPTVDRVILTADLAMCVCITAYTFTKIL